MNEFNAYKEYVMYNQRFDVIYIVCKMHIFPWVKIPQNVIEENGKIIHCFNPEKDIILGEL